MRPKTLSYTPLGANTTYWATGLTGAGPFTTFSQSTSTDRLGHNVTLTSAANLSGITLTIVGTDSDGKAVTEAITGPNIATVTGTKYFLTITSITASGTLGASTMDVGQAQTSSGPTIPVNWRAELGAYMSVFVTGTVNFSVQEAYQNIFNVSLPNQSVIWNAITALAAKTATTIGSGTVAATAVRLLVNSVTPGATLVMSIAQPDND